jgi:hypothetical protein
MQCFCCGVRTKRGPVPTAPNFDLKMIRAERPKLHETPDDWGIDDPTILELGSRLKPGIKTLETGAGLSTIIFAASGCRHTCIMPDGGLAARIQEYCRSRDIETSNITFIISKSADAIHQLHRGEYDLVLIDGCHGFPSVFVDFYYATKLLKNGGTLILDDMELYTCHLAARFMRSDPGWNMELMNKRIAIGTKISDTIDKEWAEQPYVRQRSFGNIDTSLPARAFRKLLFRLEPYIVRNSRMGI